MASSPRAQHRPRPGRPPPPPWSRTGTRRSGASASRWPPSRPTSPSGPAASWRRRSGSTPRRGSAVSGGGRGAGRGGEGGVPGRAVRPARCHRSSGGPRLRAVGRRAGRAGEASPPWEGAAGLGTGGRPAAFLMRVRHVGVGKRGCEGTGLTGGRKITRSTLERRRWPPVREAYAAGSAETACLLSRAASGPGGGRPNCPIPPRERRASLEAFRCYREILAWVLRKGAPPEGGGHCTELLLEFKEQLDDALRCSV